MKSTTEKIEHWQLALREILPVKPRPQQHHVESTKLNNFIDKSNVASTLLRFSATMSNDFSSFRQCLGFGDKLPAVVSACCWCGRGLKANIE